MNKLLTKLIVSILALTVAASLVAMSSYAWLTISGAPEVNGIQINIGGSDTIMLAPDMVVRNGDGSVSHYPGEFGQTLNFSDHDTYDYISSLAGLMPVSTADGVHWILPDYYDETDTQVQLGLAMTGQIKNTADFLVDNSLGSANLTPEEQGNTTTGNYIYLDFWVVSPADGYALRVSTGGEQEDSGSFVISRMEPECDDSGTYVLVPADETAASTVRVGFLVNQNWSSYTDALHYARSEGYDSRFSRLMGQYQEPGESIEGFSAAQNSFTIYEPNADLHPMDGDAGGYAITTPLGVVDGRVEAVSVEDRLTVQLSSRWKMAENELSTLLQQEFTTAIFGRDMGQMSNAEVASFFYEQRLQSMYAPYISRGGFVESTADLYAAATDGFTAADSAVLHTLGGATEDTVITVLPKNVPQRIRMFIWLEGQDVDCVNQRSASNLIVNLELAGSNH